MDRDTASYVVILLAGMVVSYGVISWLRPQWSFSKEEGSMRFNHYKALFYSFLIGLVFALSYSLV